MFAIAIPSWCRQNFQCLSWHRRVHEFRRLYDESARQFHKYTRPATACTDASVRRHCKKRLSNQFPAIVIHIASGAPGMKKNLLKIAAWSLCATALPAAADQFTNLDVFELEVAVDPQISPDGEQIVYVRRSGDIMTDRNRASVWIVDSDGAEHRPLLTGTTSFSSPRWSPSGDRLAYVSEAEGRGQELYVRWMDTGQSALISNLAEAPAAINWSPDGRWIAFTAFVKVDSKSFAEAPKAPDGAEWAPPVVVIDSLNYRSDGSGYSEPGFSHVFVLPAEGGSPRQITSGDFDHEGPLSWSPDSRQIVLSANRNDDWEYKPRNTDLWLIDVASGDMTQLTDRDGPDMAPAFSPDGGQIAYLGYDDRKMGYHNVDAYLYDIDNGDSRALTDELDRSVAALRWANRSNDLYIQYDDYGKRVLASLSSRGRVQPILDDVGSTAIGRPYTSGGFSVAGNGSIAYTQGAATRPADVAVRRPGRDPVRLTNLNDDLLAHKTLGAVEEITWTSSADSLEVQGWIIKPPDFDANKKYPLILEIHGGPFAAYGPHFSAELQLFAARGYVVLYTNPRGSTSYGDAFANEIHLNYPGEDYDDLVSGVDAVIEQGYIDDQQLFVTGGSGGGVLTAWIVGKTNRFAAAVVAKPVINWTSMTLYSDIHTMIPQYWFDKPPWEDQENYWRRSPLSLVGNVETPTMLLTGEADYRTPMPESEQYYQALKLRKIDSALVRVPEASHGITARPSHLIAKVDNILAWFERYRSD